MRVAFTTVQCVSHAKRSMDANGARVVALQAAYTNLPTYFALNPYAASKER